MTISGEVIHGSEGSPNQDSKMSRGELAIDVAGCCDKTYQ